MGLQSVFPKPIYLGSAVRSPIGKFGGSLKHWDAASLAGLTLKAATKRAKETRRANLVIMGHARQAGCGPNPARQATLKAGLSEKTPAITLNQACASGLTAVISACEKIAAGKALNVWAGGVESMSNTPYYLMNARFGMRMGHGEVIDGMHRDGFYCPLADRLMGQTVEDVVVPEHQISRQDQDEFALLSQERAAAANEKGYFNAETFELPAEGKHPAVTRDEHPRETTLASLSRLQPVFREDGTLTAGNSSGITDGAAFVLVSRQMNLHSMAEVLDYEMVGLDPKRMGLGPIEATEQLLFRNQLTVEDVDAFEINEAFAAQVLACQRALKIEGDTLNAWGGAIALGHPIGCSGTRILVTLLHRLKGQSGSLGVATLCVSGGMGVAVLIRAL